MKIMGEGMTRAQLIWISMNVPALREWFSFPAAAMHAEVRGGGVPGGVSLRALPWRSPGLAGMASN